MVGMETSKGTPIRRALLSVSDKRGLVEFARGLAEYGVEIISTGGTARALRDAGVEITDIDQFTGFPEMLDGRVKTLHPKVHAGILYRRDLESHQTTMASHDFQAIDLVAVNLYPFEDTVAKPGTSREEAIEQIDIGGPSMVRSAAKNHAAVTIVVSPDDYGVVLDEMKSRGGSTSRTLRRRLAAAAFARTAEYDAAIQAYLYASDEGAGDAENGSGSMPRSLSLHLPLLRDLRYGENPHQSAALYGNPLQGLNQLHGKELSYNNILDLNAALEMADWLGRRGAAVAIVKHSNPCGIAVSDGIAEAWEDALATDSQSASGGIIACSRAVDVAAAEAMASHFIEILAAPSFEPEALAILKQKKNRIILEVSADRALGGLTYRSVPGGAIAQSSDLFEASSSDLQVVSGRQPSAAEMKSLLFAWDVVRFVKSNAIVFTNSMRTLGIGAGQMSRVDSVHLAARKASDAGLSLEGSVIASDAFFPFPDGLVAAAEAGAIAAIQPGGSVRDDEVIAAANDKGMAMVFTGHRHFRH